MGLCSFGRAGTCAVRTWTSRSEPHGEDARATDLCSGLPTLGHDAGAVHPQRKLACILIARDALLLVGAAGARALRHRQDGWAPDSPCAIGTGIRRTTQPAGGLLGAARAGE